MYDLWVLETTVQLTKITKTATGTKKAEGRAMEGSALKGVLWVT